MARKGALVVILLACGLAFAAPPGGTPPSHPTATQRETAIFAGGCFWCMQPAFDRVSGVLSTTVGYTGGSTLNPTYEQVESGATGHVEAVQVVFDPAKVTYAQLLDVFWHNVDPLTKDRQFCDTGNQYRSAIFFQGEEQRRLAEGSKQQLERSGRFREPIVTEVVPAGPFYPAEDYHQEYYRKNPVRYHFYRWNCGRDQRLQQLWGQAPAH